MTVKYLPVPAYLPRLPEALDRLTERMSRTDDPQEAGDLAAVIHALGTYVAATNDLINAPGLDLVARAMRGDKRLFALLRSLEVTASQRPYTDTTQGSLEGRL